MKDKDFKRLEHKYKNYRKYSDGKEIAYGYRPDYVLYQEKEYIIFEFESGSSRKTFVGDMIKAAHFLRNERSGILVLVISLTEKVRDIASIAAHLRPYFEWVKNITKLNKIYIIDINAYYNGQRTLEVELPEFLEQEVMID